MVHNSKIARCIIFPKLFVCDFIEGKLPEEKLGYKRIWHFHSKEEVFASLTEENQR